MIYASCCYVSELINEITEKSHTLEHDCSAWLHGPHQVEKYLHTLFNLAQCNIKGSYIHAILQYSRTVVIDCCYNCHWLLTSLLNVLDMITWHYINTTLSGHRSQYSLTDIHEQELLNFHPCTVRFTFCCMRYCVRSISVCHTQLQSCKYHCTRHSSMLLGRR